MNTVSSKMISVNTSESVLQRFQDVTICETAVGVLTQTMTTLVSFVHSPKPDVVTDD